MLTKVASRALFDAFTGALDALQEAGRPPGEEDVRTGAWRHDETSRGCAIGACVVREHLACLRAQPFRFPFGSQYHGICRYLAKVVRGGA